MKRILSAGEGYALLRSNIVLLFICMLWYHAPAHGQTHPITTNQKLPESFWKEQVQMYKNGEVHKVTLEQFRGKPMILDFWSVHCGACIAGFPFLKEMEVKYDGRLVFLPVNRNLKESPAEIEKTFRMMDDRYRISRSVIYDDFIHLLFPHGPIPYYIWVDVKGRVHAITNSSLLTEQNLIRFMNRYEK